MLRRKKKNATDLDLLVEYWHNNDTNMSLQDFLGMTDCEFEKWGKSSDAVLEYIIQKRGKTNDT